jgi:fumarate reductase subunit D
MSEPPGFPADPAYREPSPFNHPRKRTSPFFAGLFGCSGVVTAIAIILLVGVVLLGMCVSAASHSQS